MTSCHISLVKLKQHLSLFLCLISPCGPQKHATAFNRIRRVHFPFSWALSSFPPPFLWQIYFHQCKSLLFPRHFSLESSFSRTSAPPPTHTHPPIRFLEEMVKHVEGIIFIINSYRPGYAGWFLLKQWKFFFLSSILHFINIPRSALEPLKKSGVCLADGKPDLVLSCWLTIGYHQIMAMWYIFNLDVL